MIYTIENNHLKVAVNTTGAELYSVYSKQTQTEYLWQGNPAYWAGRACNIFPLVGRMYKNTYYYRQEPYYPRIHGVARYYVFSVEERTATRLTLLLKDNEETLKEYPFKFEFRVHFTLNGNALTTAYEVKNTDDKTLICAMGGHPGFNVPFDGGIFEDYYLEFSEKTAVKRQLLSESDRFMANKAEPYELQDGVKLPLKHDLFDHDAVILSNTSRRVSIKSANTQRYLTVDFADYKYVGFWHANKTDAPYVCIEPWSALPATDGQIDVLETKADMTHVLPNETASKQFTIEIHE